VWQVNAESIPTALSPGGVGEYLVHIRNVGLIPSDGSTVTVVDRLPLGVTAIAAGGELNAAEPPSGTYWECAGTGTRVVTCTNNPAGLPTISPGGERTFGREGVPTAPLIAIRVAVSADAAGTGPNAVSVSGGGASAAASSTLTTIGSSPAGFGVEGFEQLSLDRADAPATRAGAHPYQLITSLSFNNAGWSSAFGGPEVPLAGGEVKDLEVGLPPGLVGDPRATPRCPRKAFDNGRESSEGLPNCPVDTQVGTVVATLSEPFFELVLPVYNLEPPADTPAQFGFAYRGDVGFIDGGVRAGEGNGLKVTLRSIDQLHVLRTSLALWGVPADHGHDAERGYPVLNGEGPPVASDAPPIPLLTNPTSCHVPLADLVSADSWEQPVEPASPFSYPFTHEYPLTDNRGNQLSMEGCEGLEFKPTIGVAPAPETTATDTPTALRVDVRLPQNEEPEVEGHPQLAEAHLRDAVVSLPAGMTVSPSVANGLEACTPAQIGLENGNQPACPGASKIGEVEVTTPLLEQPLKGFAYVAQPNENPFHSLLAVYLTAQADGALVKLAGHVVANPTTGQLTVRFDENPQLPFGDLRVSLFSGPRAALVTPSACGSFAASAQFTGWNGAVVTPAIEPFPIDAGCGQGFSPSLAAGTSNNNAGGFSPLSVTLSRPDGDQMLGDVSVTAPPGLLGMLSQVPLCGEAQAAQGACSPASEIGHTTAIAGPGPDPVTVGGGQVFLTGPYRGAPFGLAIVAPAVAGPFDLGNVLVRAAIYPDPHTARVTIVSDPLPTILQGIPLQLRAVNVTIDRSDFIFNPTSCAPLSFDGTIASSQGVGASVSSRFQAANCASLPFHPGFSASTRGSTSKAGGASLDVRVTSSFGQANIGRVFVTLPKQLPARLTTLQQACGEATFAANPSTCPAASLVGVVRAVTPVLGEPLSGPVYLVSHGGAAFPDLIVVLQGQGVRLDLVGNTNIAKGIATSTFASVPDAPVSSFELQLPQGPHSALASNLPARAHGNLCGSKLLMPTTITGQNGAQLTQNTRIAVSGCPKKPRSTKKPRSKPRKGRRPGRAV